MVWPFDVELSKTVWFSIWAKLPLSSSQLPHPTYLHYKAWKIITSGSMARAVMRRQWFGRALAAVRSAPLEPSHRTLTVAVHSTPSAAFVEKPSLLPECKTRPVGVCRSGKLTTTRRELPVRRHPAVAWSWILTKPREFHNCRVCCFRFSHFNHCLCSLDKCARYPSQ